MLTMISVIVMLMMTVQLSHTANPERYIYKTSLTNRNFDSESESPTKYYYKERRETPVDSEDPAKESYYVKREVKESIDDYTPKKYYVSREEFNNMFDDHEPKKYYTKRAIREDEREVSKYFRSAENTEASNVGKKRAKRFLNPLSAITAPLRLIGTAMEHAIESPSTAFRPSPAFRSLTSDNRPFFNDGSASIVQVDNGLSGGYGGYNERFNDYSGGGGAGGYGGRPYFDDGYSGRNSYFNDGFSAREAYFDDAGYNHRNHPVAF